MPLPSDPDGDDVSGDGVGCLKCRKDVNYDQVGCVFFGEPASINKNC